MGTSGSSSGPGTGVNLIPPWVTDPEIEPSTEPGDDQEPDEGNPENPPQAPPQVAPMGRFRGARTDLGRYASSGSDHSLRRGVGHYVRSGLGGSRNASRRMAGTARRAGALYGALHDLSGGRTPGNYPGLDPAGLEGRSAREIVDRIAEALSPSDGTQDAEAGRHSISQALSELIRRNPTIDLTSLTQEQIFLAIELFIVADIRRRIELDVGKAIFAKAPDAPTAIRRLDQMYRYVRQVVASAFRLWSKEPEPVTQQAAISLANGVIQNTFEVFESYLS